LWRLDDFKNRVWFGRRIGRGRGADGIAGGALHAPAGVFVCDAKNLPTRTGKRDWHGMIPDTTPVALGRSSPVTPRVPARLFSGLKNGSILVAEELAEEKSECAFANGGQTTNPEHDDPQLGAGIPR